MVVTSLFPSPSLSQDYVFHFLPKQESSCNQFALFGYRQIRQLSLSWPSQQGLPSPSPASSSASLAHAPCSPPNPVLPKCFGWVQELTPESVWANPDHFDRTRLVNSMCWNAGKAEEAVNDEDWKRGQAKCKENMNHLQTNNAPGCSSVTCSLMGCATQLHPDFHKLLKTSSCNCPAPCKFPWEHRTQLVICTANSG